MRGAGVRGAPSIGDAEGAWVGAPRRFRDRAEAGAYLAAHLAPYRGQDVVVLGIPRGGVPVAAVVADQLGAELDLVVACKVGVPGQPELAMGAVTADGGCYFNEDVVRAVDLSHPALQAALADATAEAQRREQALRGSVPPSAVGGRIAILVDDGLATGATMHAAVRSLRQRGPARLVVAAPVGSRQACESLRAEVDQVVCPVQPALFQAVGLYYLDFRSTPEEDVRQQLAHARRTPPKAPPVPPSPNHGGRQGEQGGHGELSE